MASIVIAGDTSGSVTLQAPAVAGSTVLNLPSTSGTIQTSGAGYTTNGVAYATSTSALSTGSALTFDGTNLGVGTTSPSNFAGYATVGINGSTGGILDLFVGGTRTVTLVGTTAEASLRTLTNTPLAFYINTSEQMRLTSTGLGIGTSSPAGKLDVRAGTGATLLVAADATNLVSLNNYNSTSGFQDLKYAGSTHQFFTGTAGGGSVSERARISATGDLLVGTTSNPGNSRLVVSSTVNTQSEVLNLTASTGNVYGKQIVITQNISDTTSRYLTCETNNGNTAKLYIYSNGNVVNANSSYGAISDVKLKENIVDATPKLDGLMQVRVRNYNLIGDSTKQLGVVAQELEQVFPAMVDESPDIDKEGNDLGTTTKSVKYSVFVPMLIKAIQEQQALINTLTDRISVLENK